MVTFAQLRDVVPAAFGDAATAWQTFGTALNTRSTALGTATGPLTGWHGDTADAAHAALTKNAKDLHTAAGAVTGIAPILTTAHTAIQQAHTDLHAALSQGLATDGLIHDGQGHFRVDERCTQNQPQTKPQLQSTANTVNAAIAKAVQAATTADEQAASALAGLTPQSAGLAAPSADAAARTAAAGIPKPGQKTPAEIKKWWNSLSLQQRESLLFNDPGAIGKLDGLPADIRDRANRAVLAEATSYNHSAIADLTAKGGERTSADSAHLQTLTGQRKGLDAITTAISDPKAVGANRPYILGLDTAGDGKAIVSIGNPDTATNVATVVPGTTASLENFGGDINRANAIHGTAGGSNATIAWLGYDAPDNFADAGSESYADNSYRDLQRFQDGLAATHHGAAHYTVIGHSYGTTVVGNAASHGHLNADDLVLVASPGLGGDVTNVNQLHINPSDTGHHVYTMTAPDDIIHGANVPIDPTDPTDTDPLGVDPNDPSFGATPITSADNAPNPLKIHGQYFDWNTTDLHNITQVVNAGPGHPPRFQAPPPPPKHYDVPHDPY